MEFRQDEIQRRLTMLGLPLDSPLSVIAVELLPEVAQIPFKDLLGHDLGQVRILRASTLTPYRPLVRPRRREPWRGNELIQTRATIAFCWCFVDLSTASEG